MAGANLAKKKEFVEELKVELKGVTAAVIAQYAGVNVEQITQLRANLRSAGVKFKVIKNKLSARAVEGTPLDALRPYFKGPTGLAYSSTDPVALAKAVKAFADKQQNFLIQAGVLEGTLLDKNQVNDLAMVPSREVLLGRMVGSMQRPYAGLVYALSAVMRKAESNQSAPAVEPKQEENKEQAS